MFGERLRDLRKERGMTQADLAEQLFLVPMTISSYECGRSVPDDATKVKIAKLFGVSLDYLLELIPEPLPYERDAFCVSCPHDFAPEDLEQVRDYIAFLQYQKTKEPPK